MRIDAAIRDVVVAGGGMVGWSAAAALRRRLPWLRVTVIDTPPPPDALADRLPCTLPSTVAFHGDIQLGEEDVVARAGSSYRLGTRFEGWSTAPAYIHAYGEVGQSLGAGSFHHQWLRADAQGTALPFEQFSAAAMLASANRFAPPAVRNAPLPEFEYGYHLDPGRYRAMMRALALHLGATARPGAVADLRLRGEDGHIEAVLLDDGAALEADLFVDATGPAARLRSRLDDAWRDWSEWLPCDRVLLANAPARTVPSVLDRVVALPVGWCWRADGAARTSLGVAYAGARFADDAAARLLAAEGGAVAGPAIAVRAGCRPEPWRGNCVAIGDAALAVEPLEWCHLHLAQNAIDRLICLLPGRDCAPVEIADYNRQALPEAERVRDFLLLHYATASRREPFWRRAAAVDLPDSLAHTLQQFRERGRLPFFEEETFARSSWLSVLIGQGVRPRRIDPLAEAVPPHAAAELLARQAAAVAAAVRATPSPAAGAAQRIAS